MKESSQIEVFYIGDEIKIHLYDMINRKEWNLDVDETKVHCKFIKDNKLEVSHWHKFKDGSIYSQDTEVAVHENQNFVFIGSYIQNMKEGELKKTKNRMFTIIFHDEKKE